MLHRPNNSEQPDTFICHASEDKETLARPLHKALTELGLHAWLDESDIPWGESIRQRIDQGISACRSATVILSRIFFDKYWTQYELDGIFQRRMGEGMHLFPIQHGITIEEIRSHSPSLAGINLLNSNDHTIEGIATMIKERLGGPRPKDGRDPSVPEPTTVSAGPTFGVFYIAPAETPPLPQGVEPQQNAAFLFGDTTGWIRMVNDNEELEFVIEDATVRVRLDWGNQWSGSEIQAAQMVSGGEPFAILIRQAGEPQIHIPKLVSRSQRGLFSSSPNRSGWMTFESR